MKKLIVFVLVLSLVFSISACGNKPSSDTENSTTSDTEKTSAGTSAEESNDGNVAYEENVVIGSEEDLGTADPYASTTASTHYFTNLTFNNLIKNVVGSNEITPELAVSWEDVNGDGTVWRLKLVENAVFHDGSPFTAEDVVFTWNYITDAQNVVKVFSGPQVENCTSVTAKDKYTVEFTLSQPMPDFITYLEIKIYSKTAFDKLGAEEAGVIGTGPYYYNAEMTKTGQQFVATRYDNYWGDTSKYRTKNLIFKHEPNADTSIASLQTGETDVIFAVVASSVSTLEADPNIEIHTTDGAYSYYLAFNYNHKEIFKDKILRQAIAQAIDKEAMVQVAFEGFANVSNSIVTPIAKGYAGDKLTYQKYDPDAAKALLQSKNYTPDQLTFTVAYPTKATELMAQVLQSDLAKIGITVNLKAVDVKNWTAFKSTPDYDMFLDAIGMQGALLYNVNRLLYRGGSSNQYGFSSATYEAAQNKVSAQTTWNDMVNEFATLQQVIVDEIPVIPLLYDTFIYATRKDVKGLILANSKNFCDFSTLYIEKE